MSHLTLRAASASVLALALAACTSEQPTDVSAAGARLDLQAAAGPVLVINEIMPNPSAVADGEGEWFEIHNAGTAPVDLKDYVVASNNDAAHVINQPLVVPAGGYVVLARNGDSTANGGVNADYSYAHQTFNLNNSATDWLALRAPDGASLDSVAWGTSSPPNGASRGLIQPSLDNLVMSGPNWSTQTTVFGLGDRGTPGAANDGGTPPPPPPPPPGTGAVVINEIMQDPRAVSDANGEWFELHNRGTTSVDLQGWTLASGNDAAHVVGSSVVIPAGGFAVLGRNGDSTTNGGVTVGYVYAGTSTMNLGNGSDWLVVRDGTGATLDSVAWTSSSSGTARALIDPASDNTNVNGAAWTAATSTFGAGDRGTPGQANGTVVDPGPPGVVTTVFLSINSPRQIPVGYTKPAFPTARDGTGATVTGVTYAWSSSDASVASVDSLGYINGLSEGTATIRATAPNGVAGTATITILPAVVPTSSVYRSHVEFGTPAAAGTLVSKREFVSSYSDTRGGPNWVSWNINATQFGAAPRCDCFSADLTLPAAQRVVDFNYRNSGYDRGHMVQSESRTATVQENAATFLMTNILPQAGESNQGPWVRFENHLNDLARDQGKEIYVVAGGEYSANPATLKNEGRVQVPEWTWKVAVVVDGGEGLADVRGYGDLQVLAVRMPNDTAAARGIRNNPWEMYATTVDDIEARTGYDLLDALPNLVERIVESGTRAPTAATDGPYVGIEGSSVTLSAAASTDPDGDALEYAWTFGDGAAGTGATPSHVYADNGNYAVTVIVTDPFGAADTATTTVTVMNAAPTVAAFAGASLLQGETYTASGSFADPGADTWTATVDYGDGSGAQPLALAGSGFALSHVYAAAGTFTVTVRVTDDDGGEGVRTATVTVQSPAQAVAALAGQVDAMDAGNGLTAKLRAASAALARGQDNAAVNQLGAFTNQVRALVQSGRMTPGDGSVLVASAQRIVASIQR